MVNEMTDEEIERMFDMSYWFILSGFLCLAVTFLVVVVGLFWLLY